jgi:hypothetical protein
VLLKCEQISRAGSRFPHVLIFYRNQNNEHQWSRKDKIGMAFMASPTGCCPF